MKAYIFDVDGTLWDTCATCTDGWNEYIKQYCPDTSSVVTEELMRSCMGLLLQEFGTRMFTDVSPQRAGEIAKECAHYENRYILEHGAVVYPGVEETFRELSKTSQVFVVSNCESGYIETFLEYTGLGDFVTDHLCPGDTGQAKAENIRLIMERNQIKNAVYIGDTMGDYQASQKAGVPFIFASYGFGQVEGVPSIQGLTDLLTNDGK